VCVVLHDYIVMGEPENASNMCNGSRECGMPQQSDKFRH
jgi:hypothetical protein